MNKAAAGPNRGVANYVLGLTQPAFSNTDYDALNTAGLNMIRTTGGVTMLFGNRTLAAVGSVWDWLPNQRLRLQITEEGTDVLFGYLFDQLDGQGVTLAAVEGSLAGVCNRHYNAGELYGSSARDAYSIDVGPSLNTPDTLAANELHTAIGIRPSPGVELAVLSITAVLVSQSL